MIDSDEAVDLEIYPVYPCFQEKPMEKPMENRQWHEFPFRPIIPPKNNQADVEKLAYNGEEAVPQIIGTLTEGAVLGDATW